MTDTDTITRRFSHPAAASLDLVERCHAQLRAAFLAVAEAWIVRRDARLLMEMSDHILKDIGIASRHERWP